MKLYAYKYSVDGFKVHCFNVKEFSKYNWISFDIDNNCILGTIFLNNVEYVRSYCFYSLVKLNNYQLSKLYHYCSLNIAVI